jgi:hypothetical protein
MLHLGQKFSQSHSSGKRNDSASELSIGIKPRRKASSGSAIYV